MMRSIGQAELAFELMVERSLERKAFGKYLHEQGVTQEKIARSRCEIEQARLLVLKTAWMIDNVGAKEARDEIAMIKVLVPEMHERVVDRAIQIFGGMGAPRTPPCPICGRWPAACGWPMARTRFTCGPLAALRSARPKRVR
ncbi:MAG: acyl-CoA dehydrogenase family protein [Thalassovita sp.]